jgi:putative salt-induced outer membrane protein YdiY
LTVEGGTTENNVATVNLDGEAANLNSVTVTYKNNSGNTSAFNIWIPVKVTYSWGTVEAWAKVKVNNTIANK